MKIRISKFGPIESVSMNIDEYSIVIGRQASGKSTLSKLIYYFMNLRDEVYNFVIESLQEGNCVDVSKRLQSLVNKRFVDFFGPTLHDQELHIVFEYTEKAIIEIIADKIDRKFINTILPERLLSLVVEIFKQNSEKFKRDYSKVKLFSSSKINYNDIELDKIQKEIRVRLNELFGFSFDLLFIPAGRSILSTLSDQLQNIHPHLLDFTMRSFITKIAMTNSFFRKSLNEIIKEKERLENKTIWQNKMGKTKKMIEKIIKGNYYYDENGGRIVVSNGKYVKINFTSSGQQESMWIVLSLFLIVLDSVDAMVFIEEPEAHLFPDGQKDITDFITLVRSYLGTRYFITTHSPYILSSINNCLYAGKLKAKNLKIDKIIDPDLCLSNKSLSAYLVENGIITNIIDNEIGLIDVGKIDMCSREINNLYSKLEDLEFTND